MSEENFKLDLESAKKEMEDIFINELINYVREGTMLKYDNSKQMKCYNIIYKLTDKGLGSDLLKYHTDIVEGIVSECYEKIKDLTGIEFIDSFLLYTERLNAFFFYMSRAFSYLSNFYLKKSPDENKVRVLFIEEDVCEFSMKIYKRTFFDKLETKLFDTLNELSIKEKIICNAECKEKILKIVKIINDINIFKPKIIKINEKSFSWKEIYNNDKGKVSSPSLKKCEDFCKKIGLQLENN